MGGITQAHIDWRGLDYEMDHSFSDAHAWHGYFIDHMGGHVTHNFHAYALSILSYDRAFRDANYHGDIRWKERCARATETKFAGR